MTSKNNVRKRSGCFLLLGRFLLVLTLLWPLFVFQRHWQASHVINCLPDLGTAGANGCGATSSTGWVVEAIWIGVVVSGIVALAVKSARKRRAAAVTPGSGFEPPQGSGAADDVTNTGLPGGEPGGS